MSFRLPRRQEMYYEEPDVEEEVVVQDDEDVEEIPSPLNFHHKMIGHIDLKSSSSYIYIYHS